WLIAGHRRRHEHPIGSEVVDLAAVASPRRSLAAVVGDSPRAASVAEGANIDLRRSRDVRRIGHPVSIGGEPRAPFIEWSRQKRSRLSIPLEWKHPQILPVLRSADLKEKEASVGRP